ncbi:MAG TPA: non-homologous end-joining DNA ligase [Egibacteraceae bacterium]|nr:non-homologous end-joining DNA ligase [Egibacteraceae bacterium]
MPGDVPTTVDFPRPLPARRDGRQWRLHVDGVDQKVTNLDKCFWEPEGHTKADVLAYYYNVADHVLPYLADRPLTLKRMPHGADGEFFYAKQAPGHTPPWVATAPVVSRDTGKTIDYLLAQDTASLLWLANLGCIELHPWHARIDRIHRPDYAFFDLDPMEVGFAEVREVALLVRTALDRLGLRGYPRTSGATGMQVYVPIERIHSASAVREWVGRVCRLINRADPERTTMEWDISKRTGKVFLDHNMNTEGKNIAATWSLRPERGAPVATPLRWEEVDSDVEPRDFTIATVWRRLEEVGDVLTPVLAGGQDLRAAMAAMGMDPDADDHPGSHVVAAKVPQQRDLSAYTAKRDFAKTPEPAPQPVGGDEPAGHRKPKDAGAPEDAREGPRFVLQHHLATRLHHDLRLERHGTAPSWAVPKGLPDVPGLRHLAVQTEDHPVEYMSFSGEIPAGEYGGGPVRIWDEGTYDLLEWRDDKVSFRLHGRRHAGEYHLFRTGRDDPSQWMIVRADEPAELPGPPPTFAPMLALDGGGEAFDDPDWLFEVKWDGVRAIATTVRPGTGEDASTRLVSRQGNDITPAYPEVASLWERVLARNAVLDGEVVAFGPGGVPSFQRLQRRMHLRDEAGVERARSRIPVSFVVFDLLAVDGEALVDRPLTERLELLEQVLIPGGAVQRSEPVPEAGTALLDAVRERGMEGLVAKRAASPYRPARRSPDWRKIKIRRTVCCVIGGWLAGEGSRAGSLGALLLGLYDEGRLRYVGRVGTGFDDTELRRLDALLAERTANSPFAEGEPRPPKNARYVRPDLVCRVEYGEVTDDGVLRAPSYKGLVPGADPGQCVCDELGL